MKKNKKEYYFLFYILKSLLFYIPVFVIYLSDILESQFQVGVVLSIKTISVFLLEVPFGYIADKFGRKRSIVLSVVANIISLSFLIIFPNFYMVILAEVFFSISETLCSGSDTALIYDNFKYEKIEETFGEFQRNISLITSIVLAISFFLGSVIYSYNKKLVFILSIVSSFLLIVVLNKIKEHPYKEERCSSSTKFNIFNEDFKKIKSETFFLKSILIYGALITSTFMGIYFFVFPLELDKITSNKLVYGIIYSLGVLLIGIGGKFQKFIKKADEFIYLAGLITIPLMIFSYLLKNSYIVIISILAMRFIWGIYSTNLNIEINKSLSSSSLRATIFSIKNAILNIFLGVLFLVMGYISKTTENNFILFKYYSILISTIFLFNYIFMRRKKIILKVDT